MRPGLVVVGVPGDARVVGLQRALERHGGVQSTLVSWTDALRDPSALSVAGRRGDFLRVESPGSDASAWHAIAQLGGGGAPVGRAEWRPGRAWFRGLTIALNAIERAAAHLVPTHPAEAVLAMTDKAVCDARLRAAGVPVPPSFAAPDTVDALRAHLAETVWHAIYVKPRWGSSGAGVLAYRWTSRAEQLTTTACLDGERVFNVKRLRTYSDRASIDRLLGLVLADGAVVQRWVPKAGVAEGPFDLRVLVVNGRIAQRIARVGRGTITNLHLDSTRLDADEALARVGADPAAVHAACERAAACFPGHIAVAIDVMVDPRGRPFVLECNAWGDLLPRLLVHGLDSYDVQVRDLFRDAAA